MAAEQQEPRQTPFYAIHKRYGARMVPFAGWQMPVQYGGILAEHHAVRNQVGLFDVSHMGRIRIFGEGAADFVNILTTNNVRRLAVGQAQYTTLCNQAGGILDDLLVYRFSDHFLMVPNAGNRDKILNWIRGHAPQGIHIEHVSEIWAQLAIQGPAAQQVMARVTDVDLSRICYFQFAEESFCGVDGVISRTGYTGEDGFELYFPARVAEQVWERLMEAGKARGIKPCGLGARDTLRLEAGLCLYGHEIDETTTPLEAGLGWIVKLDQGAFIGREALQTQKEAGLQRKLIGFRLLKRGFPRQGYALLSAGETIGQVLSGTVSPTLKMGIGTAYVPRKLARVGTPIEVEIRGKRLPAEVVKRPFYKRKGYSSSEKGLES